jgi:polyhydroxybutyrate depolymerase
MKKVVGVIIAVVAVFGVAAVVGLHAVDANGQPARTKPVAVVKVATKAKTYSMMVGRLKRSYETIAPVKAPPKSAPVIVVLSGIGSTVAEEVSRDDLTPYATANQAELVYPVGFDESWNAVTCCGAAYTQNVDDVAFLQALVSKVDPGHARNVYVVGYSNGARMAYRVACDDPDLFDGYAMVKGGPTSGCDIRKPVTLLQVASVNDPEIPYKPGDKGIEPEPMTTLLYDLQSANKCSSQRVVTHSGTMTLTTWPACGEGARLAFAVWKGGVHSFPRPPASIPAASQVIMSFFMRTGIAPLPFAKGSSTLAKLSFRALHGQGQPHDGAAARSRLGGDRAAVPDDDLADDGQAEA